MRCCLFEFKHAAQERELLIKSSRGALTVAGWGLGGGGGLSVLRFRGSVLLEYGQRDGIQCICVCGVQLDIWRVPRLLSVKPAGSTQAPAIARLQTRKAICRHWRAQIVALLFCVL